MADSGQDSAPVILPVSPANKSPATHGVDNLIADNTDVVGKIIPGTDSALFGLFKGKCSECLPSSAVTRGEESLALVCSSGFSPISRDSSSHKQPLTSLRSRASSGSGSPPRLSTPKRVSSCKLVPFHGKLIPLLPSEMLLLKDVANQSIFSCDQAALQMVFSVCLSVCPSVRPSVRHTFLTMFPSSDHHEIFRSYYQWPT